MPAFIIALGGFLVRLVGTNIGRWVVAAFAFLGLQFVAQEFAVEPVLNQIQSAMSGQPAQFLAVLAYFNVDKYITLVLSAYAVAAGMNALKLKKAVT